VYAGPDSEFVLYDDDGETFAYREGAFYTCNIRFSSERRRIELLKTSKAYKPHFHQWKIVFHGFSGCPAFQVNGQTVPVRQETLQLFEPLEKFDPINDPEPVMEESVLAVSFPETDDDIVVQW
jgi:alpha-glucosidase